MSAQRVGRHLGALLILAMPIATLAGGDAAITLGTGSGGFDSRGIDADIDLGALPLHVNAGYFQPRRAAKPSWNKPTPVWTGKSANP